MKTKNNLILFITFIISISVINAQSNTTFGDGAGANITSGSNNSLFGQSAGNQITIASFNSFFGASSGSSNEAFGNSFFGAFSGENNTTGTNNSFFGYESGIDNTTGSSNSFFGQHSGQDNTSGFNNSFFGTSSGLFNDTGVDNSFFGTGAGESNTDGSFNTFLGSNAGKLNVTGFRNVFIGYESGYSETQSDRLYIANNQSSTLIYGEFDNNKVGINNTVPEASLHVEGGLLISGDIGGPSITGAGKRLMWIPEKTAFRAGEVTTGNDHWDDANIGTNSIAIGRNARASHLFSIAIGSELISQHVYALNIGFGSQANNDRSISIGTFNVASGMVSTAIGWGSRSESFGMTAVGIQNVPVVGGDLVNFVGTEPVFVVGNGQDFANKSNALTILKNGNAGIGNTSETLAPVERLVIDGAFKVGAALDSLEGTVQFNGTDFVGRVGDKWFSLTGNLSDSVTAVAGDQVYQGAANNEIQLSDYESKIETLQNQVEALKELVDQLISEKVENRSESKEIGNLKNVPNPFDTETQIHYSIPANSHDASIVLYNIQGEVIQRFENLNGGNGSVTFSRSGLKEGVYKYLLMVDGEIADTQTMILK